MPQESGKQRQQRIEMDHYRQRGGIAFSKVALAIAGGLVGVAVLGYSLVDSSGANPGPLAEGHAAFEQDCSQCHQTLTPIGSDSVRNLSLLGVSEKASVDHTFKACTACHDGASAPIGDHHRSSMSGDWPLVDKNCAACHIDHQGRDNDLTRMSDQNCTQCHSNLAQVCPSGSLVQDKSIESFSGKHAEFASLKGADTGTVTFDHAQHMLPGQPGQGKEAMTLSGLEPNLRERYRAKMLELKATDPNFSDLDTSDTALVQLDCSSCHEFAGTPAGSAQFADAELGRHIKPISFDAHCSACHSMNPAGRGENMLPIPHAAPWAELDQWLEAKTGKPQSQRTGSNPTGIGVTSSSPAESQALVQQWKGANLEVAREMLKNQCLKCHEASLITDEAAILAALDVDSPPLIPSRFLTKGIYDHAAHAKIECRFCHEQAYAAGTPDALGQDQNVVMISNIESCNGCHRPADEATPSGLLVGTGPDPQFGGQSLWASDRCTMCHRYHTSGAPSLAATTVPAVEDPVAVPPPGTGGEE